MHALMTDYLEYTYNPTICFHEYRIYACQLIQYCLASDDGPAGYSSDPLSNAGSIAM